MQHLGLILPIFGFWLLLLASMFGIGALVFHAKGAELTRVSRARLTPLAAASPGQRITVWGRVLPTEQGHVVSPLTGRPAVALWMKGALYTHRGGRMLVVEESACRWFTLDGGSGRPVLVDPRHALVTVTQPALSDDHPALLENADVPKSTLEHRHWVAHGQRAVPSRVRVEERRVEPHALVFAVGTLWCDAAGRWYLTGVCLVPHSREEIERALAARRRRALGFAATSAVLAVLALSLIVLPRVVEVSGL